MEIFNVDNICNSDISDLRKLQLVILEIMKLVDEICKDNSIDYWIDSGTLLGARRHGGFIPWDDDCDICMPREDYEKFDRIIKDKLPKELVYENKFTKDWKQVDVDIQPSFGKIYYLGHFSGVERASGLKCRGVFIDIFPVDTVNEMLVRSSVGKTLNRISYFRKSKPKKIKDYIKIFLQKLELERIWISKTKKLAKEGRAKYFVYGIDTPFMEERFMQKISHIYPLKTMDFEGVKFMAPNNDHEYLAKIYGDYMELPPEEDRVPHIVDLKL